MTIHHAYDYPQQSDELDVDLISKAAWAAPHIGIIGYNTLTKTVAYAILPADLVGLGLFLIADPTGGSFAVTLPLAASVPPGAIVRITQRGPNACTIQRAGADTIYNGLGAVTSVVFGDGWFRTWISDGVTSWETFF